MAAGARICVGQIGAAHGVRGQVRLRSFTADPQAVASYGPFEIEDGRVVAIEALRPVKDHFVATLAGIHDRDAAAKLVNAKLFVPRERLPQISETDEFYHADLIEVRLDATNKTELIAFDEINVPSVDLGAGRVVIQPAPLAGENGGAEPTLSHKGRG